VIIDSAQANPNTPYRTRVAGDDVVPFLAVEVISLACFSPAERYCMGRFPRPPVCSTWHYFVGGNANADIMGKEAFSAKLVEMATAKTTVDLE
jgi:hypothetical protein